MCTHKRLRPALLAASKWRDKTFVDDVRTMHTALWPEHERLDSVNAPGGVGGFRFSAAAELAEMAKFLDSLKKAEHEL